MQLALYPTGTSTVNDAPLTRMYISEEETLYDAGQLYNKLRSTVVAEYPLASLLLPGWSLGSYISQDQLATLLAVALAAAIYAGAALLLGAVGREEAMALPGGERLVRWLRLK